MTDTAQPATAPVDPATATTIGLQQRTADFISKLTSEPGEASADAPADAVEAAADAPAESVQGAQTEANETTEEQAAETPAETPDARREARRAKLAELREKEQKTLAARREKSEQERIAQEAAQLRQQLEAAQKSAIRVEDFKDPAKLLALLEQHADADVVVEYLRNPKAAPKPATESPDLAAIRKELAELRETQTRAQQLEMQRQQEIARQQAESALVETVREMREDFPHVERFLTKYGQDQLAALAITVGQHAPADVTFEDLCELIEEHLSDLASSLSTQPEPKPKATPSAAAKAPPLRNGAATTRAAVADEDAPLSFEERVARAVASAGAPKR